MFRKFRRDVIKSLGEYGIDEHLIKESEHADLASTIAYRLAKKKKKSPIQLAEELVNEIELEGYVGSIESVNGYINFYADYSFLEDTIDAILDEDEDYGSLSIGGNVLIEHTSANPDGPLHVGHIRNSIIGDTLKRILEKAGIDVTTHFYVNDMGRQVALTIIGIEKFGLDEKKKNDHAVADAYIGINRYMSEHEEEKEEIEKNVDNLMLDYERGREDVIPLFNLVVNTALEGIKETLLNLNVKHEEYVRESKFIRNGYVANILETLEEKGIIRKDGAWFIDLSDLGHEKEVVIKRENGTTLYVTRDLAYHLWKNQNFERFINVLGADHKLIGKQLSDILSVIGLKPPEIIFFEFVSLPEGSMSTRKGKFISADELLSKVNEESYKIIQDREFSEEDKIKISKAVATGAVRYDFIKLTPEKAMTFNWKDALDFERQTAAYMQYSHTRACSILRKAVDEGISELGFIGEFCSPQERKLVVLLSKFSSMVEKVVKDLKPSSFAEYVMDIAINFNDFYNQHPVLKADEETRMHRLAIVDASRIVLRNGLELLGIEPLKKM